MRIALALLGLLFAAPAFALDCPAGSEFEFRAPSDNTALGCIDSGGRLEVSSVTLNSIDYDFPQADGSDGDVLTTDGASDHMSMWEEAWIAKSEGTEIFVIAIEPLSPLNEDALRRVASSDEHFFLIEETEDIEALAAGKPVLTSDREPLRSVAGDAALLVDPEDENALTEGIRRVTGDDTLRAELIRRGPPRAKTFTWDRCAEGKHGPVCNRVSVCGCPLRFSGDWIDDVYYLSLETTQVCEVPVEE